MVILSSVVDDFINKLKKDAHFENIKIIKAYPYVVKPTRLSKIVLCVGLGEIEAKACAIGESVIYGSYKLDIDIFVPFKIGGDKISNIVNDIIATYSDDLPISISTTKTLSNREALCYKASCCLVYDDIMNTGGVRFE